MFYKYKINMLRNIDLPKKHGTQIALFGMQA